MYSLFEEEVQDDRFVLRKHFWNQKAAKNKNASTCF